MENQRHLLKRKGREDAVGSMEEDRISQLPQHILQNHILFFLPQKDAVRTCILSNSWRHLGPTRPKIEFNERSFQLQQHKGSSIVANTLQRYVDQKLPVLEFILSPWGLGWSRKSCSVIIKWIAKLQGLKRLSLRYVHIEDETFEKIMSSCPLIEHLVLHSCYGLSTVKVNNAHNLKHLVCDLVEKNEPKDSFEINGGAPSPETIRIKSCTNWLLNENNYFSPRLKSLYLSHVHLPTELLNSLSSSNCPCLEDLNLHHCSDFSEFKLSSSSIKRLIIIVPDRPIKAAIDAANILYFEFTGNFLPSISFSTTSNECKSHIEVWQSYSDADDFSTWLHKLHEFLKALSQSQISLSTSQLRKLNPNSTYDVISEPVVVEDLCLRGDFSPSLPESLNFLFRVCRPRYINLPFYSDSWIFCESQPGEFIWKTLEKENGRSDTMATRLGGINSIQVLKEK